MRYIATTQWNDQQNKRYKEIENHYNLAWSHYYRPTCGMVYGMCCDYGRGSIAVYATVDGVVEILTSSDGFFGTSQNKAFTVPQSYARGAQKDDDSSSSSSRACIDSDEERQFHVDDKLGNQGCEWLSMNMDRFDYMCEFVDVASICPKTCSSCELFV